MKVRFVSWDHREQPSWFAVDCALRDVFDGSTRPGVTPIPDTGSDQYVIAVSTGGLTGQLAQALYEQLSAACLFEDHDDCRRPECPCACHV